MKFALEVFRRLRPGVVLRALHGKMKQMKRMAVYYDFCQVWAPSGHLPLSAYVARKGCLLISPCTIKSTFEGSLHRLSASAGGEVQLLLYANSVKTEQVIACQLQAVAVALGLVCRGLTLR